MLVPVAVLVSTHSTCGVSVRTAVSPHRRSMGGGCSGVYGHDIGGMGGDQPRTASSSSVGPASRRAIASETEMTDRPSTSDGNEGSGCGGTGSPGDGGTDGATATKPEGSDSVASYAADAPSIRSSVLSRGCVAWLGSSPEIHQTTCASMMPWMPVPIDGSISATRCPGKATRESTSIAGTISRARWVASSADQLSSG